MRTYTRKYTSDHDARLLAGRKMEQGISVELWFSCGFWWVRWSQ